MRRYVFRRLLQIIVILFVILTVLFVLFRLAPGDPVARMVDPDMTPEDAERLISDLGLDQPILIQYLYYLKNFVMGDFGHSFHYGEPAVNTTPSGGSSTTCRARSCRPRSRCGDDREAAGAMVCV